MPKKLTLVGREVPAKAAQEQAAALPLTDAQREEAAALLADFDGAMTSLYAARNAHLSATSAKDAARARFTSEIRELVREIQGAPNVTTPLALALGLKPRKVPRVKSAPAAPQKLTAKAAPNGVHTLQWQRMGNKPNTTFEIEAQTGDSAAWQIVGSVTATRFTHYGQVPGVKITYRVTARRAKMVSAASNLATVYAGVRAAKSGVESAA